MFAAFRNVPLSSLFVDVSLCFLAVVLASVSTPDLVGQAHLPTLNWLLTLAAAFALTAVFMFACLGLYRPARLRFSAAFWRMLTATTIAGCLAYPIFEATLGANYATLFMPRAIWCLAGCLLVGKYAGRRLRKALRVPRVLIVGTGPDAATVARDFRESKTMQRNVIGYMATPQDASGTAAAELGQAQVFDGSLSIVDLVFRHGIDEIVVAVRDQRGGNVPMDQLLACRIRGIPVLDLAGCFERARAEVPLDSLKASWLVYGKGFEQGKVRHVVKRLIDLIGATVLLALAAPVMAFAAIAVHLTSPGPILYRQERVGFRRQDLHVPEVPQHVRRRRERWRGTLGDQERQPRDAVRRLHAQDPDRRAAAVVQRAARRDEPDRPAPRASDLRGRTAQAHPVL